jgi:hypothetical protein
VLQRAFTEDFGYGLGRSHPRHSSLVSSADTFLERDGLAESSAGIDRPDLTMNFQRFLEALVRLA